MGRVARHASVLPGHSPQCLREPLVEPASGQRALLDCGRSRESGDYRNLISMIVTEGDGTKFTVAGTVLEHRHPRIVQIGEFPITFVPEGKFVYAPHRNVPGVIGRVCTIMGDYSVNISRMVTSSGITNVSADSIMILGIDNDVPQEAIDRCLQIGEIDDMKVIDLT